MNNETKPALSQDQLKRLAFLSLSNEEKMKHCVFCGEEFGPNESGHINCGGKLLDVKLPAEGIATRPKCLSCGHDAHDGERCRTAISVLPMQQCRCHRSVSSVEPAAPVQPESYCDTCEAKIYFYQGKWFHEGANQSNFGDPHQAKPAAPVVHPGEDTEFSLCKEHGFLDCSVCDEPLLPSPGNDGFRDWLDANSAGMEGEDDTEALMHVAWRAALLKSLKPSNRSEPC